MSTLPSFLHAVVLLASLVLAASCKPAAEEGPELTACKRKCNDTYTSCMAGCSEPVACGARCEKVSLRCIDTCKTPP